MALTKTIKFIQSLFPLLVLSTILTVGAFAQAEFSATELQRQIWAGQCANDCASEKRLLETQLLESPLEQVKDFRDREYPKKAVFVSGMRAILKIEEKYFPIQKSEVLAYRIDQLFQLSLAPTTVLREVNGKLSSLQLFVEGVENASMRGFNREERPQEILVFDYLTRNFDRHSENWMYFAGDDHPIAVDNDQSFILYVLDEIKDKFDTPATPTITQSQYQNFCKVQRADIIQVVSTVFEGDIALKISQGINTSREDMIRDFEVKTGTASSCIHTKTKSK